MNLGKRRLTNEELLVCFTELGYRDAAAFLASGNVVLTSPGSAEALARKLEKGLEQALSYPVPTFVRTEPTLRTVAEANPFATRGKQPGKLQVALLKARPSAKQSKAALAHDSAEDWLSIGDQELYWWPRGGISESNLDLKAVEKALGPMTIRTQGTISRLVKKLLPDD